MGIKAMQVNQRSQTLMGEEILVDDLGGFNGVLQFFLHLEMSDAFMQRGWIFLKR